jgi:hypothetical protein
MAEPGAGIGTGLDIAGQLFEFLGLKKLSDAVGTLTGTFESLDSQIDSLNRSEFLPPNSVIDKLKSLGSTIDQLCPRLQEWVKRCGCQGGNTDFEFNAQFGVDFSIIIGPQGGGQESPRSETETRGSRSDVKVEVHNYGQHSSDSQSSPTHRDVTKILGEAMAKDVRAGGPLSRSIQHTYGTSRAAVRR